MPREPTTDLGERARSVPTPDELVVHLREAGAMSIYVSRERAFSDGTIPLTVTYEYADDDPEDGTTSGTVHERLTSVFDAFGDRIWFHDREWDLDGTVEPAFPDPEPDLLPLYDRRVERKHGDGFTSGTSSSCTRPDGSDWSATIGTLGGRKAVGRELPAEGRRRRAADSVRRRVRPASVIRRYVRIVPNMGGRGGTHRPSD